MKVNERRTDAGGLTEAAGMSPDRERHALDLSFDEFGWQALEAAARRHDETVENLIADACVYFAAEVGRVATRLPRFRDPSGNADGQSRELELFLRPGIWQVLEREAEEHGAEVSVIVGHALLLYLADLESGRAVRRILDPEEQD
jgi:hypothetical protein